VFDEAKAQRYLFGDCQYMALALNILTGWPIVYLTAVGDELVHAAVAAPDGRVLDAAGFRDRKVVERIYAKAFGYYQHEIIGWPIQERDAVDVQALRPEEWERVHLDAVNVWFNAKQERGNVMAKVIYSVVDMEVLAQTARIIGEQSGAAGALADWEQRRAVGELPICLSVQQEGQRSGSYIVFDMRNPPEKLPAEWREQCIEAAAQIDAQLNEQGPTFKR
jgi:hypothetical protein